MANALFSEPQMGVLVELTAKIRAEIPELRDTTREDLNVMRVKLAMPIVVKDLSWDTNSKPRVRRQAGSAPWP